MKSQTDQKAEMCVVKLHLSETFSCREFEKFRNEFVFGWSCTFVLIEFPINSIKAILIG